MVVDSIYPEIGQMVSVRNRPWVVTGVRANALPDREQHLVDLIAVDDDAHGETLRVLWDIEPAAEARTHSTLPEATGFDPPERLDAFLDAVRWGSIASANVRRLQSPFRAGIAIEDYQLEPVHRALTMPRVNLLIADDVGLGKTIEAGLVALELILRNRANSILVICPPSLQIQWRDQMRDKFGLEFQIIDRQYVSDVRRRRGIRMNPWRSFPRLITSIDFIKRDPQMRRFQELLPNSPEELYPRRFDLLIVDEAHNVAPSGGVHYQHATDRTRAIRNLAPHFEHKLFLSATPHNGHSESFWSLLELLDDQRFARAVRPDQSQVDAVMVRRLKTDINDWQGKPRFARRVIEPIHVIYSDEERRAHRLLEDYGTLRREHAGNDNSARISVEFVLKTLKKRLFSSPEAFSHTIEQHLQTVDRAGPKTSIKPTVRDLRARFAEAEIVEDDSLADEAALVALASAQEAAPVTPEARHLLEQLRTWASDAANRPDRKAEALLDWLDLHVKQSDERVIIFTEYRDTQNWLHDLLSRRDLTSNERTMLIHGGLPREDRERIKAAFQADPEISPVRILLATDAAAEGLDFQNHCHQVIHYEIPWNPNRLEQRNGRVDRHGQRAKEVLIHHFAGANLDSSGHEAGNLDGDLEFLYRIAVKVNQIREDIGSAAAVLATSIERAMLGENVPIRSLDELGNNDLQQVSRRDLRTSRLARAEVNDAVTTLDQTRIELGIEPGRVRRAVEVALDLAEQPPLIPLSVDGYDAWQIPRLSGAWNEVRAGLEHPFTQQERSIVFDRSVAITLGDAVVHAHLRHPLVERCLRLLRAALWGSTPLHLHRVTARIVPDNVLDTPALVAHARLVVTGGDGQRLHEQLVTTSGLIRNGRFSRLNVGETDVLVGAETLDIDVPEPLLDDLKVLWPSVKPALDAALSNRQENLVTSLLNDVQRRQRQESDAIRAILDELRRTIERELTVKEVLQLDLFTGDDRLAAEDDREALERRLQRIPEELEQELAAIERRYTLPTPRLFPAAVTWLIPQSIALTHSGGFR